MNNKERKTCLEIVYDLVVTYVLVLLLSNAKRKNILLHNTILYIYMSVQWHCYCNSPMYMLHIIDKCLNTATFSQHMQPSNHHEAASPGEKVLLAIANNNSANNMNNNASQEQTGMMTIIVMHGNSQMTTPQKGALMLVRMVMMFHCYHLMTMMLWNMTTNQSKSKFMVLMKWKGNQISLPQ